MLITGLLIAAFVLFLVATIAAEPRYNLMAAGLACATFGWILFRLASAGK